MAYQSPQGLASLGRNGDSMLVHMNPTELAGLQGLAMAQGGSLTINPQTGLPEAFNLGGFFKSLLPTLVGGAFGFSGAPLMAGIAAGAATGAVTNRKNPLMGALMGGLGGYGGMGLGDALSKTMAITNPAAAASTVGQTAVSGIGPGAVGTTGQIGGANLIGSGIAGGTAGTNAAATNMFGAMKNAGVNIADPIAQDAAKQALQNIPKTSNFSGMNMDPTSSFLKPTVFDPSYGTSAIQPSGTMGGSTLIGEGRNLANSAASAQSPLIAGAMSNSPTPGFGETFIDQLGGNSAALKKIGLPLGGAVLGGLEESDIYGKPINMASAKEEEKYDPYRLLSLSGDTGLRLVAEGGYIDGYAMGGTVTTGGLRDLYGTADNNTNPQLSRDGYGVGRLENLARQQAMTQAQTTGYAMGGPVSFADGGDSNKLTNDNELIDNNLGLASLSLGTPLVATTTPTNQITNITNAVTPTESSDTSVVAQVTNSMRNDPNYQPKNPIEAAIVKQLKGTDSTQQGQGLGSLAPNTPMAPSYSPSVAMGPTYFAGMNAPQGYAEGGETSLNLDRLPSLNLNTGSNTSVETLSTPQRGSYMTGGPFGMLGAIANKMAQGRSGGPFGSASMYREDGPYGFALRGLNKPQMAKGGYLDGQGDGMSDSIPATIEGKQPARLADGEFVVPADVVSHIGNGSSKAGSKKLYAMMDRIRKARTGHTKQGKQINPNKYLPA
jgi:hypothetical protein